MTHEIFVNGAIELDLKLKINDNKGLLSAQILDFGEKKNVCEIRLKLLIQRQSIEGEILNWKTCKNCH